MNGTAPVTQFAHKLLVETSIGTKPGRTCVTVIARRGIIYFRGGPLLRSRLSLETTYFGSLVGQTLACGTSNM